MNDANKMPQEKKSLLNQIAAAFGTVPVPPRLREIVTQDDFNRVYAEDDFEGIWEHLYSYDGNEVLYLTPFLMRAYLEHYGGDIRKEMFLEMYLLFFEKFKFENDYVRERYLFLYRGFDPEQRMCICSFLRFLVKYDMDQGGHIKPGTIEYWCEGA